MTNTHITPPPPTAQPQSQPQPQYHDFDHLAQRLDALAITTPTTTRAQDRQPQPHPQPQTPHTMSASASDARRPSTPRSQTHHQQPFLPLPDQLLPQHPTPVRNRSPYARSHLRSKSGSSAPPMTRAHSMPSVVRPAARFALSPSPSPSPIPFDRPSSPLRSPKRTRSPRTIDPRSSPIMPQERYGTALRPVSGGSFEGVPSVCDISEDAELDLTPRTSAGLSSLYSTTGSLSRRRRPAFPAHQVITSNGALPTSAPSVSTPTSAASSPMLAPSKFNEHYPPSFASSSVPSTPTSMRSRSPSISSLDTIPDSPDAEDEAIEQDRIAALKAAADREDGGEYRRSSLEAPDSRSRGSAFGKRDPRKRWSVCGAERRVDLSLGTVWED
jgi:hypothetical protein